MFERNEHPILSALVVLGGRAAGGYAISKGAEALHNQQQNQRRRLEMEANQAAERRQEEAKRQEEEARKQVVQKFDAAVTELLCRPTNQQFAALANAVPVMPEETWELMEATLEVKASISENAGVLLALGRMLRQAAGRAQQLLQLGIDEGAAILRQLLAGPTNVETHCLVAALKAIGEDNIKAATLFNTARLAMGCRN